MVIFQSSSKDDVVHNCHEKWIYAPNCRDYSHIDFSLCRKFHRKKGHTLYQHENQAKYYETQKVSFLKFIVDNQILVDPKAFTILIIDTTRFEMANF